MVRALREDIKETTKRQKERLQGPFEKKTDHFNFSLKPLHSD
jgi:hypothetical protein